MDYKTLRTSGNELGETNDCGVIAVGIVSGFSYKDSWNLLKKFGRKDGKGVSLHGMMVPALRSCGLTVTKVFSKDSETRDPRFTWMRRIRTMKDASALFGYFAKSGRFLVLTSTHVAGVKDGKIEDYTENRRHRPIEIYEISGEATLPDFGAIADQTPVVNIRKRTDKYNWVLVNNNTGNQIAKWKRFPRRLNFPKNGGTRVLLVGGVSTETTLKRYYE